MSGSTKDLAQAMLLMSEGMAAMSRALRSVAAGDAPPAIVMHIAPGDEEEGAVKKSTVGRPKKEKKVRKPRAITAYNLFMKDTIAKIKSDADPDVKNTDALKLVGVRWKEITVGEKAKYELKAKELKEMADAGKILPEDVAGAEESGDDDSGSDDSDDEDEKKKKKKEKKDKKRKGDDDDEDGEKKKKKKDK